MLAAITVALAIALQVPPAGGTGAIRGEVRSEGTGQPLAGAVIEIVGGEHPLRASAAESGAYSLQGVPSGRRMVRARYIGHAPLELEVAVPAGREVRLDLFLPVRPVVLEPVEVRTSAPLGATATTPAPAPDLVLAGTRALESSPGLAELGLTDVARGVPGQEPVDPSDVLYIRGAAADLKLVYLDGAPVFAPFPLGGLLDPFTPELLRAAEVHVGGAPARYDGGLSYILDLRTRGLRPDRVRSIGAVDLLSARAMVEAPIAPGVGVLAAGRGVHRVGTEVLLGETAPYGYREGIVRADAQLGRGLGVVSLMGFLNQEEVWLDAVGSRDSIIEWGNRAVSLRYRGTVAGTDAEFTAARGDFTARLPLGGSRPVIADGHSRRSRLSLDLTRRAEDVELRYGLSYDRQEQSYRADVRNAPGMLLPVRVDAAGEVAGGYLDLTWAAAPRVRMRGGLRADHFSLDDGLEFAPRLALTWLVTDRAALTLAGGRYHQYLRTPEEMLLTPAPAQQPSRALALGSASHLSLALDQDLGEGMRLGLEGYFKSFSGVPGSDASEANASGVDLWLRRSAGSLTGWVGYSLAWVWSMPSSVQAPNRFAGRQLLSAGVATPLGRLGDVDLKFAYGAGLPYSSMPWAIGDAALPQHGSPEAEFRNAVPPTPSNLAGSADAAPLLPYPDKPFLRLDVGASRTWSGRLAGTPVELVPYLRLLNTLGQRDALFYHYDRSRDESPRALGTMPIVPVLGVEWRF
jgi:hypothetical protein